MSLWRSLVSGAGPQAQAALERIELEAERLNELIGSLLAIARLENGRRMQPRKIR